MKFNRKEKDLLSSSKIETALNEELELEELTDEEAATIIGGHRTIISASSNSGITANEYYNYAGYWGG